MWEIEQEVSHTRSQIQAMHMADRSFAMERASHYDQTTQSLASLD